MLESLEPVLEVLDEYGNPDRASFPYSESKPAREDRSFPPRGIPDVPHVTLQLIDFPNENRGVCVTNDSPAGQRGWREQPGASPGAGRAVLLPHSPRHRRRQSSRRRGVRSGKARAGSLGLESLAESRQCMCTARVLQCETREGVFPWFVQVNLWLQMAADQGLTEGCAPCPKCRVFTS